MQLFLRQPILDGELDAGHLAAFLAATVDPDMAEELTAAGADGLDAVFASYRGRPEMLLELMMRQILRA